MFTVPTPTAVIMPLVNGVTASFITVATLVASFSVLQTTSLATYVASEGLGISVTVCVPGTVIPTVEGFIETLPTGIFELDKTVTEQVAVRPKSIVLAVIIATPVPTRFETPVTSPLLSTVAIAVLLDVQLTLLLVAVSGDTVADMLTVPPTGTSVVVGDK